MFALLSAWSSDLIDDQHNEFKLRLIESKVPETGSTVYKCGPFIDLCYGPHIPDTGRIKALAVTKASSSYWLGDQKNEALQRVYGISFPSTKEMTEWKKFQEEAAQRDHRKIGIAQELFFFNEISPGSCFWLPHGTRIYNTLVEYIKVPNDSDQMRLVVLITETRKNTGAEDLLKSLHQIYILPNYGSNQDIGRSIRKICSHLNRRRRLLL